MPGRNATNSLAPWLDPDNTGAMTTNTTSMVTITGPDLLCASETYTISNLPTGSTVTGWSASPSGAVTFSGSGNSRTVTRSSGFVSGAITITATVTTACGNVSVQKELWVGVPRPPKTIDYDGMPILMVNICTDVHYDIYIEEDEGQGVLEWEWDKTGNFNMINLFGPKRRQILGFTPTNGTISIRARNACGWSLPAIVGVNIVDCSPLAGLLVYPNPAHETLTVSSGAYGHGSTERQIVQKTVFTVILYDGSGREQRRGESKDGKIQFETAGLPEGTYFVHIHKDGEVEKRQVVIRH